MPIPTFTNAQPIFLRHRLSTTQTVFNRIFRSMKWYQREWIWHVVFWMVYLGLRLWVVRMYQGDFLFRLGIELLEIPLKALALYVFIYLLIGRLLQQKKVLLFAIGFGCSILVVMWLNRVEDFFLIYPLTQHANAQVEAGFGSWPAAFFNLIYIYPVVGLGTTVYFVRSWFETVLARERLAREKAEVELKSLKDQIHPHFLFNTLNNIYSLSLAQAPQAPEMMLKLSRLLSYMIYDANAATVPLGRDLEALKNYIELERLRLGNRLEISFETSGDVERVQISPLLFFPLLENCFKHGSHRTSERIWIRFYAQATATMLEVKIENSLPEETMSSQAKGGVGLDNVRKRLALLYPRHELRIQQQDTFLVHLKIVHPWFDA